jgi:hypothetical protein
MNHNTELSLRLGLAGTKILLVGGDTRPDTTARIQSSLNLAAVVHRPTRKSDASSWRFASALLAGCYSLVICARGLTRTQHGRDLHEFCRKLELPLLNCKHLPHPNIIIPAIVDARLTSPVLRRCEELKRSAVLLRGGEA